MATERVVKNLYLLSGMKQLGCAIGMKQLARSEGLINISEIQFEIIFDARSLIFDRIFYVVESPIMANGTIFNFFENLVVFFY